MATPAQTEHVKWFDDIEKRFAALPKSRHEYLIWFDEQPARALVAEAATAIAAVFPEHHALRRSWDDLQSKVHPKSIDDYVNGLAGIFTGAARLIREGRIVTLIDQIRAESESDLLDQAEQLRTAGFLAAATVIAGGALETHLKNYCDKHSIVITGDGSISKYNGAVGQVRKSTPGVYDVNDGKLVEGWGGQRNDAAHSPGTFARSKEDVGRTIEGIREFIARVA